MIRLVANVFHHRKFLGVHLLRDLLLDFRAGHLKRKRGDDDVPVLDFPSRALADGAVSGFVHVPNFRQRSNDLSVCGKIWTFNMFGNLCDIGVRIVEQLNARIDDLEYVVRRNVGGHADSDARRAVQQDVRQSRWQQPGLAQRAVEIRTPLGRPLLELRQERLCEPREARLGVAHRGERFRIVGGAPVPLPFDQRVSHGERLGQQHHGLVAGLIAVGMELADDIAHGARGLLELRRGAEAELRHGVDDPPLHRLESVRHVRQRAVEDDVHRVVEISLAGEGADGSLLDVGWRRGWR